MMAVDTPPEDPRNLGLNQGLEDPTSEVDSVSKLCLVQDAVSIPNFSDRYLNKVGGHTTLTLRLNQQS